MSVMLDMTSDDKLKQRGISREIVNKVQKLRKAAGLHIDDHVELFYEFKQPESVFNEVLSNHIQAIRTSVKVPFLPNSRRQSHFIKVAETEYANPDNEKDTLTITICVPTVSFDEEKLKAKYGHLNVDKVNFVNDLKSFVIAHN